MAVIPFALNKLKTQVDNAHVYTWATLANGDSGTPVQATLSSDRSVQVVGTFGTGGTMRLEGSNDGTNYVALTDPQGNALDFTTAKIETVMELTRFVRPRITAGDGTTSLTIIMLAKV